MIRQIYNYGLAPLMMAGYRAWALKDDPGLNAVVYTQTTDVETECNGLLTYDREMIT